MSSRDLGIQHSQAITHWLLSLTVRPMR